MNSADPEDIVSRYRDVVLVIGLGFNPDVPYDGYEPPLTMLTKDELEEALDGIFSLGSDVPYDVGMQIFEQLQAESEEGQINMRMKALDRILAKRNVD